MTKISAKGYLSGKQLNPRDVAAVAFNAGFRDAQILVQAVAICLAESQGYERARCDNIDDSNGQIKSRDVGLWQINIPALGIDTSAEEYLYDHNYNAKRAFQLWKMRGWQPWVAHNTGIYLHDTYTGRASLGVMNFLVEHLNKAGATLPLPLFNQKELRAKYKKGLEFYREDEWEVISAKNSLDR